MKRAILTFLAVGLLAGVRPVAAQSTNQSPAYTRLFKSDKEMKSFAMGMSYGERLRNIIKTNEIDVDLDAAVKGFKDSLMGGTLPITDKEEAEILNALTLDIRARQAEKRKLLAETNKKEGEEFLAKNKNEPGVVTTASGLQYKVLTPGKVPAPGVVVLMPKPTDVVTIKYRGTFLGATNEFDSSDKTGGTVEFALDHPLPGIPIEALHLMTAGARWRVFVPSKQAFGEMGYGGVVGPNQTLIYEIELISFKPGAAQQPMTSDIIKVPSAEDMKNGAQIETLKPEDLEKERLKEAARTNK